LNNCPFGVGFISKDFIAWRGEMKILFWEIRWAIGDGNFCFIHNWAVKYPLIDLSLMRV
jgi:hypothetical protein